MIDATETRTLISFKNSGIMLRGTYHVPYDQRAGLHTIGKQNRVGVLILNSLSLPRSATGDSSVFCADSFAAGGYQTIRLDMSGLRDSDGNIPEDSLEFINLGGYEGLVSSAVKDLVDLFSLSGIVIYGHCAGSVSTIFGAAASRECKGVVIMDPYFYLPPTTKQSMMWKRLYSGTLRSSLAGILGNFRDRLKDFHPSLHRNIPPKNANFALLQRWKDVATNGLPILLLQAQSQNTPSVKPKLGEFDYLRHVLKLADHKTQVTVQSIGDTDHSFANRAGRSTVSRHVMQWLNTYFPIITLEDSDAHTLPAVSSDNRTARENQTVCL